MVVVEESVISYFEIPKQPVIRFMEVQKTILERDYNLFMSLSGLTGVEETLISIVEKSVMT